MAGRPMRMTWLLLLPSACALTTLNVCGNKACRKDGGGDTLRLLHTLCSTASEAQAYSAAARDTAAATQDAFASTRVVRCGCLGNCGMGPNVALDAGSESHIFHDVYKPKSAMALLSEELHLSIPEEAGRAYLKKMYADRAMRANKPQEALGLLTAALVEAGTLRLRAALLLERLLEQRADVHEALGNAEAASADRARAEQMRSAKAPVSSG